MTVEILFTPEGQGRCLYTEAIDLQALGRLEIRRASFVEFSNSSQLWEVRLEDGRTLYQSPSREDCLEWEREHFRSEAGALEAGG